MKILQKPNLSLLFAGLLGVFALNMCFAPDSSALGVFDSYLTESGASAPTDQTPFPNILFNDTGEKTMWGHDGKGIAFTDEEHLITESDGSKNWQYRTAKPGESIDVSLKMAGERYFDAEDTKPVVVYAIGAYIPKNMTLDDSSITVKVGGQTLPASSYELSIIGGSDASEMGYSGAFYAMLEWAKTSNNSFRSFNYADGDELEVLFSASISENARDTLGIKAISLTQYLDNGSTKQSVYDEGNTAPDEYTAKVLLSGSIMIRRLDENNQAVQGATYAVDGVKAIKIRDGYYLYSSDRGDEEFVTDESGTIVITKVPFGRYSVTETSVPSGIEAKNLTLTRDLSTQLQKYDYGTAYVMEKVANTGIKETDITDIIIHRADGRILADMNTLYGLLWNDNPEEYVFNYNDSTGEYLASDGSKIVKTADGYTVTAKMGSNQIPKTITRQASYDEILGKYYVDFSVEELDPEAVTQHYFIPNGQTGTLHGANNLNATLTLDESTGCYNGTYSNKALKICQEDDGYQETWGGIGLTLVYNEETDRYVPGGDYAVSIIIDDVQPAKINALMAAFLNYSSSFDKYFMAGAEGAAQFPINYSSAKTLAALYMFDNNAREEEEAVEPGGDNDEQGAAGADSAAPEAISNPQTSDSIVRILAIIAAATAATIVGRKKLLKR